MNKPILKYLLLCTVSTLLIIATAFDKRQDDIQLIIPAGWPKPAYDLSKNKLTFQGFQLGKKLFFDPSLSRDGSMSCGSCHAQSAGFTEGSHNISGKIHSRRNSLPLVNLAWNTSFMRDGGVNHLEVQPLVPITSPAEMNNTLENVVQTLNASHTYKTLFYLAFGDSVITGQHVLKALAQYTVMLVSSNSKYDKYIRHEKGGEMNTQELHGLQLFRTHCESCHKEPLFTNYSFQNTGLAAVASSNEVGRMKITGNPNDSLKFRVPSLRNIAVSAPYMHDGRFGTLMQVLDHYTDGVVQSVNLAKEVQQKTQLSTTDKDDIIKFLQTLTDREFLDDTRFTLTSGGQ